MSYDPTPTQALIVLGLLARHGECPQAELMPAIKASDREALAAAKFVRIESGPRRSITLVLADDGWAWVESHLSAELPPAYQALSDLLVRFGEYVACRGSTMAEAIGPKPERSVTLPKSPPERRGKKAPAAAKPTEKPKPLKITEVKKRLAVAYFAITGGQRNRAVMLSRLGEELTDIPRASLDQIYANILRRTRGYTQMSLHRNDDPRQLSEADHSAAYNPAGEPFHALWIK